ncbi:hypothetical protein BDE02_12G102000 [Populus trichocarpa]|nr:hypothetical protein BDE02_12G102000 [Populus trichocarpa]
MIRWIQKAVEPVSYEEHRQVLEERDSLKDQLSQANRKIGGLENYRAFDVQELQKYLDNQVTHGKKEIQRLEGLLGIKISPKDQHSVGEEVIKHFEHYIESKDKIIRVLENELAMKDEEMRRRLKSQVDIREEEYARLRNVIQSASTNLDSAVTTLDNAFKSRIKNPPEEGIKYMFTEKDLIGAWPSEGEQNNQKLFF